MPVQLDRPLGRVALLVLEEQRRRKEGEGVGRVSLPSILKEERDGGSTLWLLGVAVR